MFRYIQLTSHTDRRILSHNLKLVWPEAKKKKFVMSTFISFTYKGTVRATTKQLTVYTPPKAYKQVNPVNPA